MHSFYVILLQINPVLLSNFRVTPNAFDTQTFSRILLQLTSGSGYMLNVLMQFSKSIDGCHSSCSSNDKMLKKMCFLGRLHNIKNAIHKSDNLNGDYTSNKDIDILMVSAYCLLLEPITINIPEIFVICRLYFLREKQVIF